MIAILDIDNTLFDWLGMWFISINDALEELRRTSAHGSDGLLDAIQVLHQTARTSERGFFEGDAEHLRVALAVAVQAGAAFEDASRRLTVPFPGVMDGLLELQRRKIRVALHTDSPPELARERVAALGLSGLVERTFATGSGAKVHRRTTPASVTIDVVPHRKPSPEALHWVLREMSVSASEAVYLGDSKSLDIPMALEAGALAVFAEYGCRRDTPAYELLRRVTHWSPEEVEYEKVRMRAEATHTVGSFAEVLQFFG